MLKAPFPWFGGKSRVSHLVWNRFGDVRNYVEPFAGSLAVLLARPHEPKIETVNDRDAYLANFWRALQAEPEEVARHADWPVNEADLHARHRWLVDQAEFRQRMLTDPGYFDARIAGWWVWGISMWIGSGWCSKPEWTGRGHAGRAPQGITAQQKSMLSHGRMEVTLKRPHLTSRTLPGVCRREIGGQKPLVRNTLPQKRPVMQKDSAKRGSLALAPGGMVAIREWMVELAERLRYVRVCCGDWSRVVDPERNDEGIRRPHGVRGVPRPAIRHAGSPRWRCRRRRGIALGQTLYASRQYSERRGAGVGDRERAEPSHAHCPVRI